MFALPSQAAALRQRLGVPALLPNAGPARCRSRPPRPLIRASTPPPACPRRRTVSADPSLHEECFRGAKFLLRLLESVGCEVKLSQARARAGCSPAVTTPRVRERRR